MRVIIDEQQMRHTKPRVEYTIEEVPDSDDPSGGEPRKKQRAKRQEPDFVIDPRAPNKTVELETADLVSLGQAGEVVQRTRELRRAEAEELKHSAPDPKVMIDLGEEPAPPEPTADQPSTVFVDFGEIDDARHSSQMEAVRAPSDRPTSQPRAASPVAAIRAASQPRASSPVVLPRAPTPQPRAASPVPAQTPRGSATIPAAEPVEVKPAVPAGPPRPVRSSPTPVRVELPARHSSSQIPIRKSGGAGLVVFVYLLSAAALAISIYLRWFVH